MSSECIFIYVTLGNRLCDYGSIWTASFIAAIHFSQILSLSAQNVKVSLPGCANWKTKPPFSPSYNSIFFWNKNKIFLIYFILGNIYKYIKYRRVQYFTHPRYIPRHRGGGEVCFRPPPLLWPRTFMKKSPSQAKNFWGPFFQKFDGFWNFFSKNLQF